MLLVDLFQKSSFFKLWLILMYPGVVAYTDTAFQNLLHILLNCLCFLIRHVDLLLHRGVGTLQHWQGNGGHQDVLPLPSTTIIPSNRIWAHQAHGKNMGRAISVRPPMWAIHPSHTLFDIFDKGDDGL